MVARVQARMLELDKPDTHQVNEGSPDRRISSASLIS